MQESAQVNKIEIAGSIRRWKETVKDIDILTTSEEPAAVMEAFVKLPQVAPGPEQGGDQVVGPDQRRHPGGPARGGRGLLWRGTPVFHRREGAQHQAPGNGGPGRAQDQRIRRVQGSRRRKRSAGAQEEDVYKALGLPWIPPELREDTGEIEAALAGTLPELITLDDIRGDLHVHTKWSDGSHDLDTIVRAARKKGYQYIAVTDHTKGLGVAHGLDEARLPQQIR